MTGGKAGTAAKRGAAVRGGYDEGRPRQPGRALLWSYGEIRVFVGGLLVLLLGVVPAPVSADDTEIWAALRAPGHVALLRHAIAPGTGDPPGFVLGDCRTQRNLSEEGREQATRIGAAFRANGIAAARVVSSQWCRCLETAELLRLGPVEDQSILNSFFDRPANRDAQTGALRRWLAGQALDGPLVLVTHQVNITALTGVYPRSGELVVIRQTGDGAIVVVGSLETE